MSESKTLKTLREMAWQRAKGELKAYLETFWSESSSEREDFEGVRDRIERFIKEFEVNHR